MSIIPENAQYLSGIQNKRAESMIAFLISRMSSENPFLYVDSKTPKYATSESGSRILGKKFNAISFYYADERLVGVRHWRFSESERYFDEVWLVGHTISLRNARRLESYFLASYHSKLTQEIIIDFRDEKLVNRLENPIIKAGTLSPAMKEARKLAPETQVLNTGEIILNSQINLAHWQDTQTVIFLDPVNASEVLAFCPQKSRLINDYQTHIAPYIQSSQTLLTIFQYLINAIRSLVQYEVGADLKTKTETILKEWHGTKYRFPTGTKESVIPLDYFIDQGACYCRHHALILAFFISRLIQDKVLPANAEVFYYHNDIPNGRHAWVLYRHQETLIMVDSMWDKIHNLAQRDRVIAARHSYGKAVSNILERFKPYYPAIQLEELASPPKWEPQKPIARGPRFWNMFTASTAEESETKSAFTPFRRSTVL